MNAMFEGWERSWWAQAFQNRIIALVLAMIVAVPLLAAPTDYSRTGVAALTMESFALLLLTALLWRTRWDLRPEKLQAFVRTSANVPVLLFLGWVGLSCLLSPHKAFSVQYLMQIGAGALLYFAVAYQFRQSKHLSTLADVLLFLCLVISLGSMAQYQMSEEQRAAAFFGNAQLLGSFVTLLLPVVAALAFADFKSKRQIVAQITFVLMIGSLLLTQGRGAWLAALVGQAVFIGLLLRLKKEDGTSNTSRAPLKARKHLLVLPALMVVIALAFVGLMNVQNKSVLSRAETFSALGTDVSWQARLQQHWKGSAEMVAARPLLGWGAGLYPVYQHQFTGQGVAITPEGPGRRVSLAEQAHNYYLQTAVELGLPGLALMLAVLVCFWTSAWKRLTVMDAGIRRTLLMASVAATAAFAVDAVSSPSWQYAQTSMFVWLMLGVGTSCLRPRSRREREAEPAVAHKMSRRATLAMRPVAVGVCLTLATLLPTAQISAQSVNYNTNDGGTDVVDVAFGVVALSTLGYAVAAIFGGGGGAAAGGAAGAGGAGGTGAGGTGAGGTGAGGTGGVAGDGNIIGAGADATPTPTPTPASTLVVPAQP